MKKKNIIFKASVFLSLLLTLEFYLEEKPPNSRIDTFEAAQNLTIKRPNNAKVWQHPKNKTFHKVHYNSLGLRNPEITLDNLSPIRILLIGDLQIENPYVLENHTISYLLESILNLTENAPYKVYNAGLTPSALDIQYAYMEQLIPKIKPAITIQAYFPDDLDDIASHHLLSFTDSKNIEFTKNSFFYLKLLKKSNIFKMLYSNIFSISAQVDNKKSKTIESDLHQPYINVRSSEFLQLHKLLLKKAQSFITQHNSRFNTIFIPRPEIFEKDLGKINRHTLYLKKIYQDLNIEAIDFEPIFNDYFKEETFSSVREKVYFKNLDLLNEYGNLAVALTLADAILPDELKNEEFLDNVKLFSKDFLK